MLGGILREFWEILGKYRILDVESLGSKGLKVPMILKVCTFQCHLRPPILLVLFVASKIKV